MSQIHPIRTGVDRLARHTNPASHARKKRCLSLGKREKTPKQKGRLNKAAPGRGSLYCMLYDIVSHFKLPILQSFPTRCFARGFIRQPARIVAHCTDSFYAISEFEIFG